jgi:uncharacterized protein (TIGR00297 family)
MWPALTSPLVTRLASGLIISALIGWLAYNRQSLSRSGVLGAIITGTLIFGFGGLTAGLLLIAFFVSSSLLSHYKANSAHKRLAAEQFDKGGQRDLGQALANGGAAASLAVLSWLAQDQPALFGALYAAMVGALATVNADTWATELGVLSATSPRLITRLSQRVVPGTSGGVTLLGSSAALGGAAFIALCYVAFITLEQALAGGGGQTQSVAWAIAIGAAVAGLAGSLFDSLLGATVQAMYYSDRRGKETEKAREHDGTPNRLIRGWPWLNNDWVNFLASLFGAAASAFIFSILGAG